MNRLRQFLALLLTFCLILCSVSFAEEDSPVMQKLQEAYEAESPEARSALITQAAVLAEGNAHELIYCAQVLLFCDAQLDNPDLCISILQRACACADNEQDLQDATAMLLNVYLYTDRVSDACSFLQEEIQKHPDRVPLRIQYITLLALNGDRQAANDQLAKALSIHSDNIDLLLLQAQFALEDGRAKEALDMYSALSESVENNEGILWGMYSAYIKLGNFKKASRTLDKLIALTDSDQYWYERASMTFSKLLDPESTVKQAEALLRKNPGSTELVNLTAAAYLMMDRTDDALAVLDTYSADVSDVYRLTMQTLANLDGERYEEAFILLDKLEQQLPDAPTVPFYRSAAYYQAQDDAPAALSQLNIALERGISDASYYLRLGHLLRRVGQYDRADAAYSLSAAQSYDDPTALYYQVLLRMESGKESEMWNMLETLEEAYPNYYETLFMRSLLEDITGQSEAALNTFEILADNFPYMASENWSIYAYLLTAAGGDGQTVWDKESQAHEIEASDWINRASMLDILGQPQQASDALDAAQALIDGKCDYISRIAQVDIYAARACLAAKDGDMDTCADWLIKAAELGYQPAQCTLTHGFEDFVLTEAYQSLCAQYDTVSGEWLVEDPGLPTL